MDGLIMKYFVLKPKGNDIHAQASRMAMKRYAYYIQNDNPKFAAELIEWVNRVEKESQ